MMLLNESKCGLIIHFGALMDWMDCGSSLWISPWSLQFCKGTEFSAIYKILVHLYREKDFYYLVSFHFNIFDLFVLPVCPARSCSVGSAMKARPQACSCPPVSAQVAWPWCTRLVWNTGLLPPTAATVNSATISLHWSASQKLLLR